MNDQDTRRTRDAAPLLEICVDSIDLALAAARGGADRLEICGPLHDGGITPSAGFASAVRAQVGLPLAMLIRPRTGPFTASAAEFEVMRQDVLYARQLGIEHIVVGLLHADRTVDVERTRELIELAAPAEATFHRAFDVVPDQSLALEQVLAAGATRILTSGASSTALAGAPTVRRLHEAAAGRVRLMLCGGIASSGVRQALAVSRADEVHAALRQSARGGTGASDLEYFASAVAELKSAIVSASRAMTPDAGDA